VVGSTSLVKTGAVADAFPGNSVVGCECPSGVSEQPVGRAETLQGATNRARNAARDQPLADCWIGIENGLIHAAFTESEKVEFCGTSPREAVEDKFGSTRRLEGWQDVAAIVLLHRAHADTPRGESTRQIDEAHTRTSVNASYVEHVVWSASLDVPAEGVLRAFAGLHTCQLCGERA